MRLKHHRGTLRLPGWALSEYLNAVVPIEVWDVQS